MPVQLARDIMKEMKLMREIRHTNVNNFIGAMVDQVSSVVEFWRWWVLKCKTFAQKSAVNFLCQKSTDFFQKKKSFKNINLGDHFL